MKKQLYSKDLVDKVAEVLEDNSEYVFEVQAREVLDALTETFDIVRTVGYQKGYLKGYDDALTEPPF